MRRLLIVALPILTILLFLTTGCKEKTITGEGPNTQTIRDVSDFTKLDIEGGYKINVKLGDKKSIKIVAQANIIPYILTDVSRGKLSIQNDDSVKLVYNDTPSIMITVPSLTDISLNGASNITIGNISNESLALTTQGHHQAILSGKTSKLVITSHGDNEVHAENLEAVNTTIEIHGSSTVFTKTTNDLDAKINGFGKIGYVGVPNNIKQKISGNGEIKRVQ